MINAIRVFNYDEAIWAPVPAHARGLGFLDPDVDRPAWPARALSVACHDIDPGTGLDLDDFPWVALSEQDADRVAAWVRRAHADRQVRELWVHCMAGLSRSTGAALAVSMHYRAPVSSPRPMIPNPHIFRLVTQALAVGAVPTVGAGRDLTR